MGKIITVTLNPAIDKILEINNFQPGTVCTAQSSCTYPAGKGINVSRTLGCIGQETLAIAPIGKNDLPFFETIQTPLVQTRFIPVALPTRTNITIHDNGTETHIRENVRPQYQESSFPLDEIIRTIEENIEPGDIVALSGSLPANAPVTALYQIIESLRHQAYILVDSSGAPMINALDASPDLIKPNLDELAEIIRLLYPDTPADFSSKEDDSLLIKACRQLAEDKHIGTIVVSLGQEGALLYNHGEEKIWTAHIELGPLSQGQTLNTVGCGDALVAGLCLQLQEEGITTSEPTSPDFGKILKQGVALGTANLFDPVPGQVDPATVKKCYQLAQLEQLPVFDS